jgi:hypothetical protein
VAENGQIKLLRESLNPIAVGQALLPGDVKDPPSGCGSAHLLSGQQCAGHNSQYGTALTVR